MDRRNFPALTGIRFIAASFVYLFHYAQALFAEGHTSFFYFFLRQLNIGVSLFFVLSGFLIAHRYYEFNFSGKELRYYFIKRIARIFPLYYAVLAVQLLLLYLHGKASPDALTIFLNITLLKGLSEPYFFSVLTQSWSLTVEEMFYLYAPFCFYLIKAKKIFLLQVATLSGIGFLLSYIFSSPFFGGSSFMLSGTFFGRCVEFFTGIFLALVLIKRPPVRRTIYYTLGGGILFTGLLTLLGYYACKENIEVINDYFFGIVLFNFLIPVSIGVLYYGLLVENTLLKKLLSSRLLVLLGKSSYAFYLLHIGMMAEIIYFHVTSNLILLYLLLQLLSVAAYKLFEKPVYFFILRKFAIQKNKLQFTMAKIGINLTTGSLQQEEVIVGIDLGTTNSLVAIIHPDTKQPTVLKEFDNTTLVPSIVHFGAGNQLAIGNEAKQYLITEPQNTIFSVKRLMGKSYADVMQRSDFFTYKVTDDGTDNLVKIEVNEKYYSPIELSSYILRSLKQRAEHILKTPVNKAVITVPAYFNDAQRQATRDAGRLAGLDVLRIVNEPTAASLAYGIGMNKDEEKTVAVYDLGGGTFDISILRISNGIFEVLSTNGDTYLGGDDFDNAIVQWWMQELSISSGELQANKSLAQTLRLKAEEAKIHLSTNDHFTGLVNEKEVSLSKGKFNALIEPFINRTIESCKSAVKDAGITTAEIAEVVMVGGSTRVPVVKERVSRFFGKAVHDEVNPDEVVALGAAVQADILAGNNKDVLLLDITPLSLGIETMGGLMDVLIPRNSKIPSKAGRQYTTQKDAQSGIVISVYQGERDLVKDNRKLAQFTLTGIPAMPAGLPKVEISFLINADGILVVNAKELRSGVQQAIEVKPQYGLTDNEVERLLMDSIHYAREDMQQRALVEAQTEGKILINTTQDFLVKHNSYLTEEELSQTNGALRHLEQIIAGGTKDEVQQGIAQLNQISRPYAERVMDAAVAAAMKGKKI